MSHHRQFYRDQYYTGIDQNTLVEAFASTLYTYIIPRMMKFIAVRPTKIKLGSHLLFVIWEL